ncbi:MAG: hypothetical protein NZ932_06550 [Candidatus Bathyarchaeota archaeon]|nr:hypothetical protein [Candidatus Bathyarchaeota archaeon]MDW8040334.1 hypothetical protein [Nitrososphaerota archaeon]
MTSKWYWIIVSIGIAVFLTPYLIVLVILYLPPPINAIAIFGIIVAWGIVAGYKDWIISQRKGKDDSS